MICDEEHLRTGLFLSERYEQPLSSSMEHTEELHQSEIRKEHAAALSSSEKSYNNILLMWGKENFTKS